MEQANKLLTVIVPVYNVEAYLTECVNSLLQQTYAPMEILLVDDGAADGSGILCEALAKEDARIRVFHKENGGQASAKNLGIEEAKGAYLAFVDGDDTVLPETYAAAIGAMEETGATVGEFAFNYVFPDHAQYTGGDTGDIRVFTREEAIRRMALSDPLMIESARKVYARETVGDARFPEGQLYEEVGFLRRIAERIDKVVYIDRPYYQYRQNRAGSTNTSFPPTKLPVIAECDAFAEELRQARMPDAADAVDAFALDHIMRLFRNAVACRADTKTLQKLRRAYRQRYQRGKANPYVRKLRGMLFALSPDAYDRLTQLRGRLG